MSAQIGTSVLLEYGPQGTQQIGNAVLLDTVVAAVTRRVGSAVRAPWVQSLARPVTVDMPFPVSSNARRSVHAPWVIGSLRPADKHAPWIVSGAVDHRADAPWLARARTLRVEKLSPWIRSRIADDLSYAPWGRYGDMARVPQHSGWGVALPSDAVSLSPWGGPLVMLRAGRVLPYPGSDPRDRENVAPWGRLAATLTVGVGISIPPDDGIPDSRVVVPIRSVYVQVNATSLRRVNGNVLLPTISLNMSLDFASWVWSFNASLPADALADVEPVNGEPVELEATVNGTQFRLLAERISRDRTFGKATISVSGRGKAALLDAPYAPVMSFGNSSDDLTVQQLMYSVLQDNGVPIGWDVDFRLADWLVPTGMFTHSGTYIDAINRLAEAGGGYVQAHAMNDTLQIFPKYPRAPWEWATLVDPDFELPSAPVTRESIEWTDMPRYNRVYVQGVQGGVLGRVTRAGTAGNLVAQTIVEPLATHADAARQRGLPVLAETGRIAYVTLRLPVLAETGVITPGQFVRYVDGDTARIGLVRSTNLDIAMPQVWQSIKLETHVEPV